MSGKQHISFRCRLLCVLFLFFNAVCTAAPVIRASSEDYKQAVSLQLAQNPNAAGSEEENQVTASYLVQFSHFSFKRQHSDRLYNTDSNYKAEALPNISWRQSYITSSSFLPRPAYYAFLFRYKLF